MFTTVKNLNARMQNLVEYFNEANGVLAGTVANNNDLCVEKITDWKVDLLNTLDKCFIELKRISTDDKLINRWDSLIKRLKEV